mgnify:CR=1 FL=1
MPRDEDQKSPGTLLLFCVLMVVSAILNSLSYKKVSVMPFAFAFCRFSERFTAALVWTLLFFSCRESHPPHFPLQMLNSFKSQDPENHPHNYEFFVNQINVAMYWAVAAVIVRSKAVRNPKW